MKKTRIYLDTSVISFLLADDAPEKQAITQQFFETCVAEAVYEVVISPLVIDELAATMDTEKRSELLRLAEHYALDVVETDSDIDEIGRLTKAYVDAQIIPANKEDDAAHIAIATINGADVLLSWNYKHLANLSKERKILAVNLREGYAKPLRMLTPMEVLYGDDTGA